MEFRRVTGTKSIAEYVAYNIARRLGVLDCVKRASIQSSISQDDLSITDNHKSNLP